MKQALLTREVPYSGLHRYAVSSAILQGLLPFFPDNIGSSTDLHAVTLREICRQCWDSVPSKRPEATVVLSRILNRPGRYFDSNLLFELVSHRRSALNAIENKGRDVAKVVFSSPERCKY